MRIDTIGHHLRRLRREFGQRLELGSRRYRVRGYLPNRFTTGFHHERHLLVPITRAMKVKPGLFVDVGVNTGQTLIKVLSIDPERAYLGFEPQVGCAFYTDQFLRDNAIDNARVLCLALSDTNSLLPIYANGQFDEMATLVTRSATRIDCEVQPRYIPARIGDEVMREIVAGPIGVLKVDVEGAEISVFRGLRQSIVDNSPACFFEVLPNYVGAERLPIPAREAAANREAAAELMGFFHSIGYEVRQIDTNGHEQAITAFDLDQPERFVSGDYVAYPA